MGKIETIWDYKPTEEELNRFGGRKAYELAMANGYNPDKNDDNRNYRLGLLFTMRGEHKKAKTYFDKIQNRSMMEVFIKDF